MDPFLEIRRSVIEVAQALLAKGFFGTEHGTAGNVSARVGKEELVAVTPTGRVYQELETEDICIIDFDENLVEGELQPSLESSMHLCVYRNRPDVGAVLHTHQHYASVLSVLNLGIPPLFDEVTLYLGHPIDVVPYGLSGSPELKVNVDAAVGNWSNAYILQNHGALCLGETLDKAVRNAELLEKVATVYYHALCTGKEVTLLPKEIMDLFHDLHKAKGGPQP
jgi:ribulose-5-phosphate 4-epimerase/fuculose-1-phosphate aldolase